MKAKMSGRAKLAANLNKALNSLDKHKDRVIRANDFRALKPDEIHPRTGAPSWTHRCDAIREFPHACDTIEGAKDLEYFRCHLKAKFSVHGQKVCVRHAGILALERMLGVSSEMAFWQDDMTKERLKIRARQGGRGW